MFIVKSLFGSLKNKCFQLGHFFIEKKGPNHTDVLMSPCIMLMWQVNFCQYVNSCPIWVQPKMPQNAFICASSLSPSSFLHLLKLVADQEA